MKYSHFRKEALMYNKNIITEQYKTKNTPMYLKRPRKKSQREFNT